MSKFHPVGGMQLQVYLLAKALAAHGISQDVITVRPPWEPNYNVEGLIKVFRYGWPICTPRQMYAVPAFNHIKKIKYGDYDLVHCHSAQDLAAIPLGLFAARRARVPFIVSLHSSWQFTYIASGVYPRSRQFLGSLIEKEGLRTADAVVVLTTRMAEILLSNGQRQTNEIFVIPDGVGLHQTVRTPEPKAVAIFNEKYGISGGPLVVFVGRLSQQKGVAYLIRAFAKLCRNVKTAKLIIAGDGPYRAKLQTDAMREGIADRTVFTGFLHHDDVPLLMASATVLVVPSVYEEFGSVLLEAMAMGLPIIASRVGGICSIIRHNENGLLVSPKSPSEIADSIHLLLSDRSLALQLAGRAAKDAQAYEFPIIAKRMVETVYEPLLGRCK
jgi:glycogen synthase